MEYDKPREYDADTADQPTGVFFCHQADVVSDTSRVCAGWSGCHESDELLALRLAVITGCMDPITFTAVVDYESPVPLFSPGREAANHGQAGIDKPGSEARHMISKITRTRTNLVWE